VSVAEPANTTELPLLQIQALGRFTVLRGHEAIPASAWGTHRARALLKLLLTQHGRPLHKEQIIDSLWPNSSPKIAVQSLYTAVSDLRRVLEPGLARAAASAFIRTSDGCYRFDTSSPHSYDAAEFAALVAHARAERHATPQQAAHTYARACALYAGDFLPADLYAPWSDHERHRLRELALDACVEAADLATQLGHERIAVEYCRRALALDPCREPAWHALIAAYAAAGEPAQALRAYHECAQTLERELGIAPPEPMRELAAGLAAAPVAQPSAHAAAVAIPFLLPAPEALPSGNDASRFVGRVHELVQLTAALQRAAHGQGGVMFVVGESGIGKSALVAAALAAAPRQPVARGFAHELTQGLAYHPLAEALRDIARSGNLPTLDPRQQTQLARLAPELVPDALPAAVSTLDDRAQLFEALRSALLAPNGLTVVLEDLHWADDGTLAFLAYLAPQLGHSKALVIASCRPSEALTPLIARGGREPWLQTVRLGPLDEGESAALVAGLVGQPGSQALGRRLHRASGGNPLYLLSTLDRLQDVGQLQRTDDGRWIGIEALAHAPILPVPDEVAALGDPHTAALAPPARRLLHAAAVLDQPCPASTLELVVREAEGELGDDALLDGIDALLETGLLRALPDETLAITHDALREAIYARLNPLRRQRLHAVAAAVFTIHGDAARQQTIDALVGEHLLRCEQWQAAVSYLLRAGDAAAGLYAYAEARRHFERALHALDRLPERPELRSQHVDVLLRLDHTTYALDLGQGPLDRLARAEHLARGIAGPQGQLLRAQVALVLARAYVLRNAYPAALVQLKQAHADAEALGDRHLTAVAAATHGAVLYQQGRFDEAERVLLRTLVPLERAGNWEYWLVAITYHSMAMGMRGALAGGLAEAQRGLKYAEQADHIWGRVTIHAALCLIGLIGDDHSLAKAHGEATLALAEASGDMLRGDLARELIAWSATRNGDHELADLHLAAVAARHQPSVNNDWWLATAAERALLRGDAAQALSLAHAAVAAARASDVIFSEGLARRVWGEALAQQGDLDGANAQLAEAVRLFEAGGARLELARAGLIWGNALYQHDAVAAAREQWRQASAQFAASGLTREHAEAQRLLAATERR
jgi:DNA-binding SARP family transcriptional activator